MRNIAPAMTTASGMGSLPDLVEEMVGAPGLERVFRRSGLPLELTAERSIRVPMAAMVDLFSEAARETGRRDFGLQVGLRMRPSDYGLWMEYSLAAPTLRAAIARLAWAIPLHQTGSQVDLSIRECGAVWSYVMPRMGSKDMRSHSDHVVPTMIQIARLYLGPSWLPAWVGVGYRDDGQSEPLMEVTKAPWRFEDVGVSLPIGVADLDRKRSGAPAGAGMITRADVIAERMARASTFTSAVEGCIALGLLDDGANLEAACKRLDLGARTLQRALRAEGTSFKLVLESFRQRKAQELLSRSGIKITDVALALGYADPSNFTRAYRNWTGHPPSVKQT